MPMIKAWLDSLASQTGANKKLISNANEIARREFFTARSRFLESFESLSITLWGDSSQ
jgi:hypothetical protein